MKQTIEYNKKMYNITFVGIGWNPNKCEHREYSWIDAAGNRYYDTGHRDANRKSIWNRVSKP